MSQPAHLLVSLLAMASVAAQTDPQSSLTTNDWSADHAILLLDAKLDGLRSLVDSYDRRYQELFDAQQATSLNAIESANRAVFKAETALEKRLEATNEWRRTVDDITKSLITRSEVQARFDALAEKTDTIQDRVESIDGQSSGKAQFWGWIVGGVGVASAIFTMSQRMHTARK